MVDKSEKVKAVDSKMKTSAINVGANTQSRANVVCYWNNTAYSVGATVCDNGSLLRCEPDGSWSMVGTC